MDAYSVWSHGGFFRQCAPQLLKGLPSALPRLPGAPACFCSQLSADLRAGRMPLSYSEAFPVFWQKTQSKIPLRSRKPCLLSHWARGEAKDSTPCLGEGLWGCLPIPSVYKEKPGSSFLSLSVNVCLTYWNLVLVRTMFCLNIAKSGQSEGGVWFQCAKPEQPMIDMRNSTKVWKGKIPSSSPVLSSLLR